MADGPAHFVDARRGNDRAPGTQQRPWRTINHALEQLQPGDTLYLRSGTYFESVYCSVEGLPDAPITIRSYPGEQAVIDGGIRGFQEEPDSAWRPYPEGAPGEFVSAREYRNLRDVVGLFGDSNIGLQTYWHAMDLRAENELWMPDPSGKWAQAPVYCGPGIWYDRATGRIHCRLAHTHIDNPLVANYQGETDPRRLPLVIAPFQAAPLFVDLARHVRFEDLVLRGGGYRTVELLFGVDVAFDNCTIFGGTYPIWAKNTGPLTMTNCGVHGNIPPWAFATENSLHTYTPRYYDPFLRDVAAEFLDLPLPPYVGENAGYAEDSYGRALLGRNVARLNTHAVLVCAGGYEFETFYYPFNHDWDIAWCEFTDGHDGIYPGGQQIRVHHCWIDNIQDDGIYTSSPTPGVCDQVHIYQNLLTRIGSAFASHNRGGPGGEIYIYRNVADLRGGVQRDRPTPEKPQGGVLALQIYLKHGTGEMLGMESMYWYQNTLIAPATYYSYAHRMWAYATESAKRRCFNNICVYLNRWPDTRLAFERGGLAAHTGDIILDGNLHWCANPEAEVPTDMLDTARTCAASERMRAQYPDGWAARSVMADPRFRAFSVAPAQVNDYRLAEGSPALGGGVVLPEEFPDPERPVAGAAPDIGALPGDAEPLRVGRGGRVTAGQHGPGR
ncbi:MAG: DUF1565 domain-containing protein [Armatimonadota bacterium]